MGDDARELIRYHADGKVGVVTIDRPEKRNAMTYTMLRDFIETEPPACLEFFRHPPDECPVAFD